MNNDLSKKIVEKIKAENLQPKPKWHFLLKDWVLWILGGVLFVVGGIIFSIILYFYSTHDFELYHLLEERSFEMYLKTVPFLWILFLLGFIYLADYQIQQTKRGYKYTKWKLLAMSILASMILGLGIYTVGSDELIERTLEYEPDWMSEYTRPELHTFSNPEEGLLVGKILGIQINSDQSEDDFENQQEEFEGDELQDHLFDQENDWSYSGIEFSLQDINQKEWSVYVLHEDDDEDYDEYEHLRPGMNVRLIGDIVGEGEFAAEYIRPFRGKRGKQLPDRLKDHMKKPFGPRPIPPHMNLEMRPDFDQR